MLVPSPAALRELLDRYTHLSARTRPGDDAETLRQLDDLQYTLCVYTGTRSLPTALETARSLLRRAYEDAHPHG